MSTFHGVFPALITPFHRDGTLNEQAFRDVMETCIQAGVDGFWVSGGTGESVVLSDEENIRVTEISADQSRGRIQNIIPVGRHVNVYSKVCMLWKFHETPGIKYFQIC